MDNLTPFVHVFINPTWGWTIWTFKILNRTSTAFECEYHCMVCVLLHENFQFLTFCNFRGIQGLQNILNRTILKHQLHKKASVPLQQYSSQNVFCTVWTESLNIIQIVTVWEVDIILVAIFSSSLLILLAIFSSSILKCTVAWLYKHWFFLYSNMLNIKNSTFSHKVHVCVLLSSNEEK
jgi:hypothetical protein